MRSTSAPRKVLIGTIEMTIAMMPTGSSRIPLWLSEFGSAVPVRPEIA